MQHYESEHERIRHQCDVCDRTFSTKGNLMLHRKTHTGEKPYQCNVCGKSFSQTGSLKKHMRRTHTGEKPYRCDKCRKSFSDASHLTRHKRVHTAEKPFQCPVCKASYKLRSNLNAHLRTHTGVKPFLMLQWKCQAIESVTQSYATNDDKMCCVLETVTPDFIRSVTGDEFKSKRKKYLLFKTGINMIASIMKVMSDDPAEEPHEEDIHDHLNKSWRDYRKENAKIIWEQRMLHSSSNSGHWHTRENYLLWKVVSFYGLPQETKDKLDSGKINL